MIGRPAEPDELEARLRRGDEEALAELSSQHRERLWRMVNFRMDHRLSGRIDPDDVLQEGYLAAAQRLAHYAEEPSMSPFVWLRLIVNQTLIDLHRHHLGAQMRDAHREVPIRGRVNSWTTATTIAIHLAEQRTSPSQAAVRAELFAKVEDAVAGMDPIDQEVLALRHFEELTNSEVAEVLGIEQKAASIRYIRAIRRLKKVLSEVPGLTDEFQAP